MTTNQLRYWENQETKRANQAKERETNRSNIRNEALKKEEVIGKNIANTTSGLYNLARALESSATTAGKVQKSLDQATLLDLLPDPLGAYDLLQSIIGGVGNGISSMIPGAMQTAGLLGI